MNNALLFWCVAVAAPAAADSAELTTDALIAVFLNKL